MLDILVGGFYGDEGKGKIASYLAMKDNPSMSVRTGGINAGHTIMFNGRKLGLRSMPSAFVNPATQLAMAPGSLIRLDVLNREIAETGASGRLIIDPHTAVITDEDVEAEKSNAHLSGTVGSTLQGVGTAESRRILRKLKLAGEYQELSGMLADVPERVLSLLDAGRHVHVESTQGHFLSLFHGEYPYVTSRNTTASGVLSEVGIGPGYVDNVIVVFKSFITRVGGGPLEGEISSEEAKRLGVVEYGTVTGRQRRVALFDPKVASHVARINSATQIAITKLDVKFPAAKGVREYDGLPEEAKRWLEDTEKQIGVPITLAGTGEETMDTVDMRYKLKA